MASRNNGGGGGSGSFLNPRATEFFPARVSRHPIFRQPLHTPLLLPPPPPCWPNWPQRPLRPPSRPVEHFGSNQWSSRGGYQGRRRNPPLPPPRMRRSWPKQTLRTETAEESSGDAVVYTRIVEHRNHSNPPWSSASYYNRRERCKMPLSPGNSTVMIRNIPNKYTRKMLMDFLDEHCSKENKKLLSDNHNNGSSSRADEDSGVFSAYDFLYLPFDLRRKANLGYAFVNFTHPKALEKFHSACHNKMWEQHCCSRKICELAAASLQGKEELIKHFETTGFACDKEEFLPVCFSPPGRGSGQPVCQRTVGILMTPSRESLQT